GTRRAGAIIRRVSRHCEGPLRAQEATKIAIAPGINRNRRVERLQDVAASRSLEREEEEAFVVAIVKLRDHDRPSDRAARIMAHTGGALSGERITGAKKGGGGVGGKTAGQVSGSRLGNEGDLTKRAGVRAVVRHVYAHFLKPLDELPQGGDLRAVRARAD